MGEHRTMEGGGTHQTGRKLSVDCTAGLGLPQGMEEQDVPDGFLAATLDDDFGACIDMDAPGTPGSQPSKRKFGGLRKARFRRRSMQETEEGGSAQQIEQLSFMNQWWDDTANGEPRITTEQLTRIIKANYTPSSVEVDHVCTWLDISKDGRISFDEYCVGMAKVLERANLTGQDDLAAFEEAMSEDLARLLAGEDEEPSAEGTIPSPLVKSYSKADLMSPELVESVKERLGEDLLTWLRAHFDEVDTDKTGDLDLVQLENLVKKTYVPRGHHLDKFMKWFALSLDEAGTIGKEDYIDSMVKLHHDLNFTFSPSPSPQLSELLSPKHCRSNPNSPVVLSAVDMDLK